MKTTKQMKTVNAHFEFILFATGTKTMVDAVSYLNLRTSLRDSVCRIFEMTWEELLLTIKQCEEKRKAPFVLEAN